MQKVLVAGSTGKLGEYVLRTFKKWDCWVRVLARNPDKLYDVKDLVDDVFVGDLTRPATLNVSYDDIEIVFSSAGQSVGINRLKYKARFRDMDYRGNRNLLDVSTKASVIKFICVAVFGAHLLRHLEYIEAHEHCARDLKAAGLDYAIVRPTGFFTAYVEFSRMAHSGRAYIIGDGRSKIDSIHEADVTNGCVEAVESLERDISVG